MDSIARKRGSASSDTTGVRDSVVNQLLAKMDGVKEASNVLVVGLTNRPELLDPALLRPGRLEVQLRVELPDLSGRRDILRIHTRRMREAGGLSSRAVEWMEDLGEKGMAATTEHFSGAELAGLVRSAASFALARTVEQQDTNEEEVGVVSEADLKQALKEVRPALGKQDDVLRMRFPLGISRYNSSMMRITRDLERFTAPVHSDAPRLQSLLLVGAGNGGAGATALAAWAAAEASSKGSSDYVRFVTSLDVLSAESGGGDEARAAALVDRFAEAREMSHSLLVLDDVDQLCAGTGPGGYSSVMIATLRALLRSPPASASTAKAGGQSLSKRGGGKTVHILGATSRSDAACSILHELFDETIGKWRD
jgi:vesicle-fusing ATPase